MSKTRKSAKGRDCTVRLVGICNGDPSTTVLAHKNGGGMGLKKSDNEAAYACSACHYVIDRLPSINHMTSFDDAMTMLQFVEGIFETQQILLKEGLMTIK